MATRIYVTSAEGGTGKSTIAVGLLETLKGSVARVGVFRDLTSKLRNFYHATARRINYGSYTTV